MPQFKFGLATNRFYTTCNSNNTKCKQDLFDQFFSIFNQTVWIWHPHLLSSTSAMVFASGMPHPTNFLLLSSCHSEFAFEGFFCVVNIIFCCKHVMFFSISDSIHRPKHCRISARVKCPTFWNQKTISSIMSKRNRKIITEDCDKQSERLKFTRKNNATNHQSDPQRWLNGLTSIVINHTATRKQLPMRIVHADLRFEWNRCLRTYSCSPHYS